MEYVEGPVSVTGTPVADQPVKVMLLYPGLGRAVSDNNLAFLDDNLDVIISNPLLLEELIGHAILFNACYSLIFLFQSINSIDERNETATRMLNDFVVQRAGRPCIEILAFYGGRVVPESKALLYAAQCLNTEAVAGLIYHGADPHPIREYVKSVETSFREKNSDLADFILSHGVANEKMIDLKGTWVSFDVGKLANIRDGGKNKKIADGMLEVISILNGFSG
ncbi:hypothetical protein Dsui_2836 [Azospira oryzae PS]|uniref:Uncharacterized protein n=1 Tax=Azospira oryzae (strain ATCC BAA-33 / DSM 13638 / PS) TaxID=640081 RepID=G8QFR2_AZOOP|nr:hypothetical protein [Azospira oryzae]AEV27175.1 hypothetical protein Dsui_2836 [Azospira oryzae PS]